MELSSDNLSIFVFRRYKQRENKNKQDLPQKFKISKMVLNPKNTEKKENKQDIINYFNTLIINNSNISNFLYNSKDPFVNECFSNLEFLSIANNYIRSLDFIIHLPNLFFLDAFGNPLDDLTALNSKNIFGYLRLSVELFNEKKILEIFDLQCGILDINLNDKNNMRIFNMNNHQICMINNDVNYLIDKIKSEEERLKAINKKKNKNEDKQNRRHASILPTNSDNCEKNNLDILSNINMKTLIADFNSENIKEEVKKPKHKKSLKRLLTNNLYLLKIKNFFDEYQKVLNKKLHDEFNKYLIESKQRTKVFLSKTNELYSSKNLVENKNYLEHEKNKLLIIFDIYRKISVFNRDKISNKYYIGNIYNINVNKTVDSIFVDEIKNRIMNQSQSVIASIILLISIIFYTIGVISEKMMNALINYILTKYYKYDENEPFPDFANMGNIHYLSFYYSTYDYIYKRLIDNKMNISINKYKKILDILQMKKLVIKSNYLYQILSDYKTKDNNKEFYQYRKNRINNEVHIIKELDITNEFIILLEFLCDYIIYEKIELLLINNSFPGEYSYFIELKETLEENKFKMYNQNLVSSSSLSDIRFQKHIRERIFNKFYFEKDKIKSITNKDFNIFISNDSNKSKNINKNNINSNYKNNMHLSDSFSNFKSINQKENSEENEYDKINKKDTINVDEFFFIDSKSRNSTLYKNKNKNYISACNIKMKEREKDFINENSYLEGNNSSLKLPNLFQEQQKTYEEFEYLKNMIFNSDFLSQHARNLIKFEKWEKKINKYPSYNRINASFKKNKSKQQKDKEKPFQIGEYGSPNFKSLKNSHSKRKSKKIFFFPKSRFNSNLDSNPNENSVNSNSSKKYHNLNKKYKSQTHYIIKDKTNFIIDNKDKDKDEEKEIQDKNLNEINNKTIQNFGRNNNICLKHGFKMPFREVPESFPGITLLKFGLKKNESHPKNIKLFNKKKNSLKIEKEDNEKSYKKKVMNKIKQTVKDNFLRSCQRFVGPMAYKIN